MPAEYTFNLEKIKPLSESIAALANNMVHRTVANGERRIVETAMDVGVIPRHWRFDLIGHRYFCKPLTETPRS